MKSIVTTHNVHHIENYRKCINSELLYLHHTFLIEYEPNHFTLGPAYNEHFNAWKSARCSWVLVVTKLFNIVVNEMVSAQC